MSGLSRFLLACVLALAVTNVVTILATPARCDLETDMCIDADEWALGALREIGAQEDADELLRQLSSCQRMLARHQAIEASRQRSGP